MKDFYKMTNEELVRAFLDSETDKQGNSLVDEMLMKEAALRFMWYAVSGDLPIDDTAKETYGSTS